MSYLAIGGASEYITNMSLPGISHDHVTVGVELELAIFIDNHELEQSRDKRVWYAYFKEALKNVEERLSTPERTAEFRIKDDPSINVRWKDALVQPGVPVEIATPILVGGEYEWVIPEVCTAINKVVKTHGASIDLDPKSECGLHVHIGVRERHYTLAELKRIAKAIVIFEDAMDMHHAESRSILADGSGALDYIRSNRRSGQLMGLSIAQMVERIDTATTTGELLDIVNKSAGLPDKFFKYNLTATRVFGTVEFRQAEGSIDSNVIVEWIRTVITFVISAVSTGDDQFPVLAYMAEQEYAWSENISAYYGLPTPDRQAKPPVPRNEDDSDEEESEDILPDMADLSLGSGGGASASTERPKMVDSGTDAPLRRRDTLKKLGERVSTKLHSYHIRERLSHRIHGNHIQERLANRIIRALAKVAKRMSSPPA